MIAHEFEYRRPTTLMEATKYLADHPGTVRVLGQPPREACARVGYLSQHPGFPRDFPITVEQAVLTGRLGTGSPRLLV